MKRRLALSLAALLLLGCLTPALAADYDKLHSTPLIGTPPPPTAAPPHRPRR